VFVNGTEDERDINHINASPESSLDKLTLIASKIEEIRSGELKEVEVREACRALNTLAHSINKDVIEGKSRMERGELAWTIFRRLLVEDNLFDPVEDSLLPIHGYPIIVDHAICHNVSWRCLVSRIFVLFLTFYAN